MAENRILSTERDRAVFVLSELCRLTEKNVATSDALSFFAGLSSMIMVNGLGHALAFVVYRGEKQNDTIYKETGDIIISWLIKRNYVEEKDRSQVFSVLASMPQRDYINAQTEILRLSDSLKIYSRVVFQDKGGNSSD